MTPRFCRADRPDSSDCRRLYQTSSEPPTFAEVRDDGPIRLIHNDDRPGTAHHARNWFPGQAQPVGCSWSTRTRNDSHFDGSSRRSRPGFALLAGTTNKPARLRIVDRLLRSVRRIRNGIFLRMLRVATEKIVAMAFVALLAATMTLSWVRRHLVHAELATG